jgi:hypothetical protein
MRLIDRQPTKDKIAAVIAAAAILPACADSCRGWQRQADFE